MDRNQMTTPRERKKTSLSFLFLPWFPSFRHLPYYKNRVHRPDSMRPWSWCPSRACGPCTWWSAVCRVRSTRDNTHSHPVPASIDWSRTNSVAFETTSISSDWSICDEERKKSRWWWDDDRFSTFRNVLQGSVWRDVIWYMMRMCTTQMRILTAGHENKQRTLA